MTLTQWSYFLTVITAFSIWISFKWSPWGWGIGVLAQIPWAWYAIVTDQTGFIWECIIIGAVYANNFWKAYNGTDNRHSEQPDRREPATP